MTITDLVEMAERVHDAEGWSLGAASSRVTRNAFWARVVGCAYHGHPRYNPTPDPRWHLKRASADRPQSDDVVVLLPSRQYWDCIDGAGQDGYAFGVRGHAEPLPADQLVYAPPIPEGAPGTVVDLPAAEAPRFPPRDASLRFLAALDDAYRDRGRPNRGTDALPLHVDDEGLVVWLGEFLREYVARQDEAAARDAVLAVLARAWR